MKARHEHLRLGRISSAILRKFEIITRANAQTPTDMIVQLINKEWDAGKDYLTRHTSAAKLSMNYMDAQTEAVKQAIGDRQIIAASDYISLCEGMTGHAALTSIGKSIKRLGFIKRMGPRMHRRISRSYVWVSPAMATNVRRDIEIRQFLVDKSAATAADDRSQWQPQSALADPEDSI